MKKQTNRVPSSLIQIFSILLLTGSIIAIIWITIWDRHQLIREVGKFVGGREIIPILILGGIVIVFILTIDHFIGHVITLFIQFINDIFKINIPSKVRSNAIQSRRTKQNGPT